MRRSLLFFPALLVAACLPGEKTPDAGDGGTELDGTGQPPYTGDARNDIAIYTGDARNDVAIFDAPDLDDASDDAGDAGDAGDAAPPSGCPTATAPAGIGTVLIGWSYAAQGLIAMRADGSVVPVVPLASSASLMRDRDLLLWSAQTPYDPDATSGRYDAVLVDRAANVRWRFTREIGPADYGTVLFVDGRTAAAALGFTINRESAIAPRDEGVAILPDGAVHELPGVTPSGPPRPDGWIPWVTTTPGTLGYQYGFIHAETGEKVPVHMPVLGTSGAFVRDGVYVYRSWTQEGETGLVVDDPAGATWYPTPIGSLDNLDRRFGLSFTALGPLVSVDGRPRWLLRDMSDFVDLGPLPEDDGGVVSNIVGQGDWVLVLEAGMPRWGLQLSTTTFVPFAAFPTPPPAPAMTTTSGASLQVIDHWAAGTGGLGHIWRLDLASGTGGYLDPAPLRQFVDGCGRHTSELLPDGTVAVGLRDDYTAGAFVRGPTDSDWRRVGRPLIGVSGVWLHSVGNLLGVEGVAISSGYCPRTPEQWSPLPAGTEMPLQGASSQIVLLPGSAAAFVNTGSISAKPGNPTIHPSGACGLWNDQVHNFETGETFTFPSTYALWW